ncbi:MAG: hypothetical protein HY714_04290, partial [Candidatus Omnitrophica bacterium]|nr:hypothetical protein [Candidatus Omnitrophota bacterium]
MNRNKRIFSLALLLFTLPVALIPLSGCDHSYPEARMEAALKEICKKEYGVERVEMK